MPQRHPQTFTNSSNSGKGFGKVICKIIIQICKHIIQEELNHALCMMQDYIAPGNLTFQKQIRKMPHYSIQKQNQIRPHLELTLA